MKSEEWRQKGRTLELGKHRIFYVEEGQSEEALVILHGYPSSSYDYWRVLPTLAGKYRVIVHDHPGFGFSAKPKEYSYSLIEQCDVALMLWKQLGISQAHVLAHDYGTSIATELVARHNRGLMEFSPRSITLCNGSVHIELSQLRPIQKLLRNRTLGPLVARLSTKRIFLRNMRNIWGDPERTDEEELSEMWDLLIRDGGRMALPKLSQYMVERYRYWERWVGGLRETKLPVSILWADLDPVAVPAIAEALHQDVAHSRLRWLKGLGHYPMLEDPDKWSQALIDMLADPYMTR